MVGLVLVSHSKAVAESILELTKMMADGAPVAAAGGLEDGSFGTSYERIYNAIDSVNQGDGVVVLMDMGSAVMTTEMVIEDFGDESIKMVDAPIVEGAVAASVACMCGEPLDSVLEALADAKAMEKF